MYRRGGNVLKAVSKALGVAKEANKKQVTVHNQLETVVKDINKKVEKKSPSDDAIIQA